MMKLRRCELIGMVLLSATLTAAAEAQSHEPDPEAVRAFETMIKAYRARPALTVKTGITITITEGEVERKGPQVNAELVFDNQRRGHFKLRGYECFISDGEITAIHGETDEGFFQIPDDDSPYYTLMNMFMDVPFPHLAIAFGEESIDDICMQFHPKAPWVKPTGVEQVVREGQALQIISLTSDYEDMEIAIDPETKLIQSIDLEITGGYLVQNGATMRYEHTFEYEIHEVPLAESFYTYEPGDRQRMDMLVSLAPRPKQDGPQDKGLVGQDAPGFVLETIDGNVIDLEDLQGEVVILDFWATWCGPCIQALPLLHEVALWAEDELLPVRVLTVNVFEGNSMPVDTPEGRKNKASSFWSKKNFTLPVLMDYSDQTAMAYGVNSIPSTFIISPDGKVHTQHVGLSPDYVELLKNDIIQAIEAMESDDEN